MFVVSTILLYFYPQILVDGCLTRSLLLPSLFSLMISLGLLSFLAVIGIYSQNLSQQFLEWRNYLWIRLTLRTISLIILLFFILLTDSRDDLILRLDLICHILDLQLHPSDLFMISIDHLLVIFDLPLQLTVLINQPHQLLIKVCSIGRNFRCLRLPIRIFEQVIILFTLFFVFPLQSFRMIPQLLQLLVESGYICSQYQNLIFPIHILPFFLLQHDLQFVDQFFQFKSTPFGYLQLNESILLLLFMLVIGQPALPIFRTQLPVKIDLVSSDLPILLIFFLQFFKLRNESSQSIIALHGYSQLKIEPMVIIIASTVISLEQKNQNRITVQIMSDWAIQIASSIRKIIINNNNHMQKEYPLVLIYFKGRGKLQPVRNLISYLDLPYYEVHLNNEDTKTNLPQNVKMSLKGVKIDKSALPTLLHKGNTISDTYPIMSYICRNFNSDLFGKTIRQRARVNELMEFIVLKEHAIMMEIFAFAQQTLNKTKEQIFKQKSILYQKIMNESCFVKEICIYIQNQKKERCFVFDNITIIDFYFMEMCVRVVGVFKNLQEKKYSAIQIFFKGIFNCEQKKNFTQNIKHITTMVNYLDFMRNQPFYKKNQLYLEDFSLICPKFSQQTIEGFRKIWVEDQLYIK